MEHQAAAMMLNDIVSFTAPVLTAELDQFGYFRSRAHRKNRRISGQIIFEGNEYSNFFAG